MPFLPADPNPDPASLLVVVVGAHLAAEIADRPTATFLADTVRAHPATTLTPVVVTDLWYLNAPELRVRPTVSIGAPEVNAATAFWAARVPTALVCDEAYRIHLDPELVAAEACLWGVDGRRTRVAAECFVERYLDGYLDAVAVTAG